MKALIYIEHGKIDLVEKDKPTLKDSTDAIVRILKTTICGTDLHIIKGDVPSVDSGRILGHEGVGIIEDAGAALKVFKKGDHVLLSCITSCGICDNCRKQMYSHCRNGGWILGNTIDGTQAEYVRIPYADTSLYQIPDGSDEEALVMLSDILPTGFECGVLNGKVKPGDTIAIVGAGPIGLATLLTSKLYSPSGIIVIDKDNHRLEIAKQLGATETINSEEVNALEHIMRLTNGEGVNTAIEAVGIPDSFELCESIIAPGGIIANIGVHGKPVTLHLETLWSRNITITTKLVDTSSTAMLLNSVIAKRLKVHNLITHRFKISEIIEAYEIFKNASKEKALKVIISNEF